MGLVEKSAQEIKSLSMDKIQGATDIARFSLLSLKKDYQQKPYSDFPLLRKKIILLSQARPNEPLISNLSSFVLEKIEGSNLEKLPVLIDEVLKILEKTYREITFGGTNLLKKLKPKIILTHCHSTSVVEILIASKKQGFEVYLTETRPLYQGRKTAKELSRAGIKCTMIADSAASYLISKEDAVPIDLVLLGCDVISINGGSFNKVGSYGISLAAKDSKVPLYIVGTLLKTSKKSLEIEKRQAKEIWKWRPRKVNILNLAFDYIPPENINGIVTEFGIVGPDKVKELVKKNYSFI